MFCGDCGTRNSDTAKFCESCGYQLLALKGTSTDTIVDNVTEPAGQTLPPQGYQPTYSTPIDQDGPSRPIYRKDMPQIRNWWIWMFVSFFTFGLGYLFYSYQVLEDLNKLESNTQHSGNSYANTRINSGAVLFLFFIPPVYYYLKYNTLYLHLADSHRSNSLPITGQSYAILLVVGFILLISVVGSIFGIGIYIYLLIQDNRWQYLLNNHIRDHDLAPN